MRAWRGPDRESGQECFAILHSISARNVLFALFALAIGFGGGVGGGLVADRISGDDPAPQIAVPPSEPSEGDRLRAAIALVLPAVVTVIAELPPQQLDDGSILEQQNIGSGIVISDEGHVITNFHVVTGAEEVSILLVTGERRSAVAVWDDSPYTDLAVIRVSPQGLRKAQFGDSTALTPGDTVVAITGGSLGLQHSVSAGIVSALGRTWPRNGVILEDLVQTDAAVNHGDSGGALVNLNGEVVGLITTVVRRDAAGRTVEGVAFAQSSNSLAAVVESIVSRGRFLRPRPGIERPGIHHLELSPAFSEEQGFAVSFGALVLAPEPGSPAELAGVLPGDIVVALNGVAVDFVRPLPNLFKDLAPGADAELSILRGARQLRITISPWRE